MRQGAIRTYISRKSRFLLAELMEDRKLITFNQNTLENFKYISNEYIRALHQIIE